MSEKISVPPCWNVFIERILSQRANDRLLHTVGSDNAFIYQLSLQSYPVILLLIIIHYIHFTRKQHNGTLLSTTYHVELYFLPWPVCTIACCISQSTFGKCMPTARFTVHTVKVGANIITLIVHKCPSPKQNIHLPKKTHSGGLWSNFLSYTGKSTLKKYRFTE